MTYKSPEHLSMLEDSRESKTQFSTSFESLSSHLPPVKAFPHPRFLKGLTSSFLTALNLGGFSVSASKGSMVMALILDQT